MIFGKGKIAPPPLKKGYGTLIHCALPVPVSLQKDIGLMMDNDGWVWMRNDGIHRAGYRNAKVSLTS